MQLLIILSHTFSLEKSLTVLCFSVRSGSLAVVWDWDSSASDFQVCVGVPSGDTCRDRGMQDGAEDRAEQRCGLS